MNKFKIFKSSNKKQKFFFYFSLIFLITLIVLGVFVFKPTFQGKAILNLEGNYQNNSFNGNVLLNLKDGELIPSDSVLIIENKDRVHEFSLNQFIEEPQKQGEFYIEDKNINGSGFGYGFYGVKKEYPKIEFKFYVVKENKNESSKEDFDKFSDNETSENLENISVEVKNVSEEIKNNENLNESSSTETSPEIPQENVFSESVNLENTNEETILPKSLEKTDEEESVIEENNIKEPDEVTILQESVSESKSVSSESVLDQSESISEPTSEISESSPGIITAFLGFVQRVFLSLTPTGQVSSDLNGEISGSVKYGEEFKYNLDSNENIKIVSGSVKTKDKNLSEEVLIVKIENSEAIVSTFYFEEKFGFGKDYVGNEKNELKIDLSNLNLSLDEGLLKISINYNGGEISKFETIIQENQTIIFKKENETTLINETKIEVNKTEIVFGNFNLTSDELKILINSFGNVSVKSSSLIFKDRIIVTFNLNSYESKYSYDSNLSDDVVQSLIERDRTNWLRDIVSMLSAKKLSYNFLNKFNESVFLNSSF